MHKSTGIPLAEGIETATDLPHTISFAVLYRERIDSFNELPKDKRPPRNLWDKPYALEQFLDTIWGKNKTDTSKTYLDFEDEELE